MKPNPHEKDDYTWFTPLSIRWKDNDVFGHVNNAVYYSYFDTIVNTFLIDRAGFHPLLSPEIGYIVSSSCDYFSAITFPNKIVGGFRVNQVGRSSVQYGVAIFLEDENTAVAQGTMTHVFVSRDTERPAVIPDTIRTPLLEQMKC